MASGIPGSTETIKTKPKALQWFRFYTEVVDDPKIHRLSDVLHRFWINCLCLAGRNGGVLPAVDDIAFHIRKPAAKVALMMRELVTLELLEEVSPEKLKPHNWSNRQYEGESSSSRVRHFRERRMKQRETVSETLHETDETLHETERNGKVKRLPSALLCSVSDLLCSDSVSEVKKNSLRSKSAKRSTAEIEKALSSAIVGDDPLAFTTRLDWWVEFWAIYPCHDGKQGAMDAFDRKVTSLELWDKVLAGAVRYRKKTDANPEIALKYGQGWINGERWEDEVQAPRVAPALSPRERKSNEIAKRMDCRFRRRETGNR